VSPSRIRFRVRTITDFLLPFVLVLVAVCRFATAASGNETPVVVELFTSEACSSCPPADALLTKLNQQRVVNGAEVFVLGEHVDYFNHLGWIDRFSSSTFTERQNSYAKRFQIDSAYTPQIVIDGRIEGPGTDPVFAEQKIGLAAHAGKAAKVALNWTGQNLLQVNVAGAAGEPSVVLLAITEDGLTTSIGGGENNGRVLRHSGVVRELRQLGTTSGGNFTGTASIVPAGTWNPGALRIVVFVQRPGTGNIIGAAAVNLR
jgi:hypothetical protein